MHHENAPMWKHSSIESVGFHNHLYTRVLAGAETGEIENWFEQKVETPAAQPIVKATTDSPLTPDDWGCLMRFLAAQDARTPARMIEFLARQTRQLPGVTGEVLRNAVSELTEAKRTGRKIERPLSDRATGFPSRVTSEIEPGAEEGTLKLDVMVGRSLWLWSLKQPLEQTYKVLRSHKWTIVRPPLNMSWLTSDNPVVKLNYYGDGRYDFKGGWGRQGTEILLPLGPRTFCTPRLVSGPHGSRVSECRSGSHSSFKPLSSKTRIAMCMPPSQIPQSVTFAPGWWMPQRFSP